MHLIDTTMFFCARSGGVKRYLLAKHAWLRHQLPNVRHSMLVPASPRIAAGVVQYRGSSLPLVDGYRFPLSRTTWKRSLIDLRPDLIEAGDPYVAGRAARDAAHTLGIPSVAFCHSDVQRLFAERIGRWTQPAARRFVKSFYTGFDLVLAPSKSMLHALEDAGVRGAVHQPLGVDTEIFHPSRRSEELRRQLRLTSSQRLLVYAGRFAREKNLPTLIEVAHRLGNDYHLLLIGGRRRESIGSNVTIWPYQRNTEMLATLIASSDVFVHAGENETFGLVLAEAMACAIPVVGIRSGGVPEVASDDVGALAAHATTQELCAAIQSVFERDTAQLGQLARQHAEREFGWDAIFSSLLTAYARLIDARQIARIRGSRAAAWQPQ